MDEDLRTSLLSAYGRLLTPLVRILLREGTEYPALAETLKRVFVDVAREAEAETNRDWASSVALVTGLNRAEVIRIVADRNDSPSPSRLDQLTRVLTAWHTDPDFTGPYGLPLELRLDGNDGGDFVSLVATHSPGSDALMLMGDLRRIGAVKETEDGWFKVLTRTFLPHVDMPESFERIGRSVQFLVETVDFNRQQPDDTGRLLERTVNADNGIRLEDLPLFRDYVRSRAQVLLEEIDNWLSHLDKPNPDFGDVVVGTGVGIYHYIENTTSLSLLADSDSATKKA
jgi:hypothetical protein